MFQLALSIIVAMDKQGLIGKGNELPWHLPEDLRYFKKTTSGKVVVMGRKTFESIGKPLPNRHNVVFTRDKQKYDFNKDLLTYQTVESIIEWSNEGMDIFIIGGSQIYGQFYPYCDNLYITYVNDIYEGDTKFPIPLSQINEDFEILSRKFGKDKNIEFLVMGRKA
jgi:dihydrofolate reductase